MLSGTLLRVVFNIRSLVWCLSMMCPTQLCLLKGIIIIIIIIIMALEGSHMSMTGGISWSMSTHVVRYNTVCAPVYERVCVCGGRWSQANVPVIRQCSRSVTWPHYSATVRSVAAETITDEACCWRVSDVVVCSPRTHRHVTDRDACSPIRAQRC